MSAYDVFEDRVEVSVFNSVQGGKPIKSWTGRRTGWHTKACEVVCSDGNGGLESPKQIENINIV